MTERKVSITKLPSLGKFYKNYPNADGSIELYPIRVIDEKILGGSSASPGERVNTLLKSCLKTQIPVEDLLLVDRIYLLIYLGIISYGPTRKVVLTCPNKDCKTKFNKTVDLINDFECRSVDEIELPGDEEVSEPFTVDLPESEATVELRFLRASDEASIRKIRDQRRKRKKGEINTVDETYVIQLALPITKINNEEVDLDKRISWVEELHAKDAFAIRSAYEERDFGLSMSMDVSCPNCDEEFSTGLPVEEFFRPTR